MFIPGANDKNPVKCDCTITAESSRSISCTVQLAMKVKELIKLIESDGWVQVRMKGSHRQFKHRSKPGKVTVAGKFNVDIPPGTLHSALRQAGLSK